jgi:stage II sporulation protein D
MSARKRRSPRASRWAAITGVCVLALVLSCCQSSYHPAAGTSPSVALAAAGAPRVRVAVLKDIPSAQISCASGAVRVSRLDGQVVKVLPAGAATQVMLAASGLVLDGAESVGASGVCFESTSGGPVMVNGREVAPRVVIHHAPGRPGLLAVAQLNLEEYLIGVLAGEVPYDRWHAEALKAQAVASRSYALFQMQRSSGELYDVESTVLSQVYRSGYQGNSILNAAVGATRGLVLTSNGNTFPAYFHSTCGGRTEAAAYVFPEYGQVAALRGAACRFCSQSPSFRWQWTMNKTTLSERLRQAGRDVGRIVSVTFLDAAGAVVPPPSGARAPQGELRRAATVVIQHSGGTLRMQGNQFRIAVSAKELKSLLFEQVLDRGEDLAISGGGFGHGVGLCQYGAEGMAAAGYNYPQILGNYYPGAALKRMY